MTEDVNSRESQVLRPDSRSVISANLPEPVVVASVVLAIGGLLAGAVQLTVVCGIVVLVVWIARLWARVALTGIDITRTLSKRRVFAGDLLYVEMLLENRKVLPLPWLSLNFNVPDGLRIGGNPDFGGEEGNLQFGRSFIETFSLQRFERVRAQRPLLAEHRGCYRLGAATVESGDLFGFYASRGATGTHPDELVVMPVPRALPGFSLPARARIGSRGGRANLQEDPSRPGGVREYRPGDALARMDWKATARHGLPLVKVYDPSTSHHVLVLLDAVTSPDSWRFLPQHLEAVVAAAASVCVQLHDAGQHVGLLTNGLPLARMSPFTAPGTGTAHLDALMLALARVQATPPVALESLYAQFAAPLQKRGGDAVTLVYVTALAHSATHNWLSAQRRRGLAACCVYVGDEVAAPDMHPAPGVPWFDYSQLFTRTSREQQREATVMRA